MPEFIRPRPIFPKRAVVTSGMPYGNKEMHFGHIAMTLRADTLARFLRDRIGKENVIFVSGTDCYGSTATESFRKLKESGANKFANVEEFVKHNHELQKQTMKDYEVSHNLFGASALEPMKSYHRKMSEYFITTLLKAGMISKHKSLQFYDKKFKTLLNGRQVIGKCPIEGCQSEKGYADECDLGHQYLPMDLLNPISALSGEKPELVEVENWYFDLDKCTEEMQDWLKSIENKPETPGFMVKELKEFLKKPEIYVKREYIEQLNSLHLPKYELIDKNAPSVTLVFDTLSDRETACKILSTNLIRYRTGKTLVPFRLTGNTEWGVPCPVLEGLANQTFYVWPESLWAPISLTQAYLVSKGKDKNAWKDYWMSKDAVVYQVLGEDNISFYGPAQQAMWLHMQGKNPIMPPPDKELQLTSLIPIKHLLYLDKKASSSGAVKPPMAKEFLNYYTPEQLRMHFMGMNLTNNNVNFMPKPFNPNAKEDEADPVLKEGNLLTNVYNRILRTLFYSVQKYFDGRLPDNAISEDTKEICKKAILDYERYMYDKKFHQTINVVDVFVRNINKNWVKEITNADEDKIKQLTVDTVEYIRVANILLHPLAPTGTEKVANYLGFDNRCFDWNYIFEDYKFFKTDNKIKFLEEKEDFFKKHPSQLI